MLALPIFVFGIVLSIIGMLGGAETSGPIWAQFICMTAQGLITLGVWFWLTALSKSKRE